MSAAEFLVGVGFVGLDVWLYVLHERKGWPIRWFGYATVWPLLAAPTTTTWGQIHPASVIPVCLVSAFILADLWLTLSHREVTPALSVEVIAKIRRHQLRNEMADRIARGRLFQSNVRAFTLGGFQNPDAHGRQLLTGISTWHMEVLSFIGKNISHADAMRLMAPALSAQYPPGVQGPQRIHGSEGFFNFEHSWDCLTSDIAALEDFLRGTPEL